MRDPKDTEGPKLGDASGRGAEAAAPAERLPFRPEPWWAQCLLAPRRGLSGGAMEVPVPDLSEPRVALGRRLAVEVQLGPDADPVRLRGPVIEHFERLRSVAAVADPAILVGLDSGQVERVTYVRDVLRGERPATARRHRRYATELFLQWDDGVQRHEGRAADLSLGGAAVEAQLAPPAGSAVLVRWPDSAGDAVEVASTVAWVRSGRPEARFGLRFRPDDEAVAARVARLVRRHGRRPTPPIREVERPGLHSGPP